MEINRDNYESFFLLYLDQELNPSEISDVEKFLSENTDLQKEFSLLRQTILIPGQAIFDQKELLFRKEEKRRVIPMYWTRIAAAVAILLTGGWLLTTQLTKKQTIGITGSDNEKKVVLADSKVPGQKTKDDSQTTALSEATVNKVQAASQQNSKSTNNESAINGATTKSKVNTKNDLAGKNNQVPLLTSANPDLQNQSSAGNSEGSNLVMQKSNVQEIQPMELQSAPDQKQIAALTGSHAPVVLIAAAGTSETVPHVQDEKALLTENEDQTDNAISVVALNDKNKSITGFFKKLTRRTPTDASARKVRVSVFQFSY